jgi:hypothetical protein
VRFVLSHPSAMKLRKDGARQLRCAGGMVAQERPLEPRASALTAFPMVCETALRGYYLMWFVWTGGELTTLFGEASTAGLTGAEYASDMGELKLAYDASTYGASFVGCVAGVL